MSIMWMTGLGQPERRRPHQSQGQAMARPIQLSPALSPVPWHPCVRRRGSRPPLRLLQTAQGIARVRRERRGPRRSRPEPDQDPSHLS